MPKITTVEEYKKKYQRGVQERKLPSGAVFKVRPLEIPEVYELYKILPREGEIDEGLLLAMLPKLERIIIPKMVIEPKVTVKGSKDSISIKNLTISDKLALIGIAFEMMGIGEEAQRFRISFRRKPVRSADS